MQIINKQQKSRLKYIQFTYAENSFDRVAQPANINTPTLNTIDFSLRLESFKWIRA